MSEFEENYNRKPRPPHPNPERFSSTILAIIGLALIGIAITTEADILMRLALGAAGVTFLGIAWGVYTGVIK